MATEERQVHRRALIATAIGGLGALFAKGFTPEPVYAGVDGDVVLGAANSTNQETSITSSTSSQVPRAAFAAIATNEFDEVYGLDGSTAASAGAGVRGVSTSAVAGMGVKGRAANNAGVGVYGEAWHGVQGRSLADGGFGVVGISEGASGNGFGVVGETVSATSTGVAGISGPLVFPYPTIGVGVWGTAVAAGARAVLAQTTGAVGVRGEATTGTAGSFSASSGVAGSFESASGLALNVSGRAHFNRSGVLAVGAGKSSIVKSLGGLTSSSVVLAVLRTGPSATYVRKVTPGVGKFTVYFNVALRTSGSIAWIAFD